jgi:hypothetical protein
VWFSHPVQNEYKFLSIKVMYMEAHKRFERHIVEELFPISGDINGCIFF